MSDTGMRIAAWLLTYALHSTVLLAAAALLTARWVRGEAWRETLWKAALVGGLLTATVQSAGWIVGDLGRWSLASAVAPAADPTATASRPESASPSLAAPDAGQPPRETAIDPARRTVPLGEQAARTAAPPPPPADPAPSRGPGIPLGWTLLAWGMGAGMMLLRLALRQWRLRRLLADRAPVEDDAVFSMLAGLRRDAGIWRSVRLTTSAATPTPLALGGGEICVPPRFLTDLDPDQQRSALAHELAHLARRDPAWHFGVSILEALFWFQPLNRVARARLRESAEFLCDAWAARQTGSPLGLARCLAEVASWVAPGRHPIPAGTMAMAEGGSPLVQRVQRLTSWRGEPREGSGWLRMAAAGLLVAAVAAIAPAVASTDRDRAERPSSAGGTGSPRAVADEDGQEIVVIRHPAPATPLAARWAWAVEEMDRRRMDRAWIAYSVPTILTPGAGWLTDSGDFHIGVVGRAPLNRVLDAPVEHAVMLFTVGRNGDLERVAGRIAAGMDVGRLPVLWLGPAEGAESFAQLRRLADGLRVTDLRESLVEMIGIHRGDGTVPYLAAVLGRDGSNGVRREAAQSLGHHPTAEALTALRTAVQRDGSDDVRREAVEAMGRMGTPASAALLRELALHGSDHAVRREAVEALGRAADAGVVETLAAIALADRDAQVAREAVEALEHAPAGLAGPVLVRIAWTSRDGQVARQAAESLGRLPAPWAVVPLDSIARAHPDESVAQQAVESLGGYRDAVSGGYIRRIARTHRSVRVREEARDQLAGGGGDPDPDPDRDVDFDPGFDPDPDFDPDPKRSTRGNAKPDTRSTP